MNKDPNKRIGSNNSDADEIKAHSYFSDVDWENILLKKIPPPKVNCKPKLMHVFSKPREFEDYSDLQISSEKSQMTYFSGWSFVNKIE